MKKAKNVILAFLSIMLLVACKNNYNNLEDGIYANISTNKGDILINLEYKKVPVTVANFISLAEGKNTFVEEQYKGKPFYDGITFHRVISVANGDSEDFMIQCGDPLANGSGGPGYKFSDEFNTDLKHSKAGILSMANGGPNTNGSQFFITHKATPWLDNVHTVFGEVLEGMDVVNAVVQGDVIEKVEIIRVGTESKKFDAAKVFKDFFTQQIEIQKEKAEKLEAAKAEKVAQIEQLKLNGIKSNTGLIYQLQTNNEGKKPKNGTQVFVHYAGYFTNGDLFDTSYDSIAEKYGKLDPQKLKYNGYNPFPFKYGDKQGLIPGFIESLEKMKFGDKLMAYIPSNLGYGVQGMGNVIAPNTDIVFEIELLETLPKQ